MDIKEIVRQHPRSVAASFKRFGINSPVTANELMLNTILLGPDFIDDLANQVMVDESFSRFDGLYIPGLEDAIAAGKNTPTLEGVTVTAKKKSNKLKNTLNDLVSIVANGLGTYKAARTPNQQPILPGGPYNYPVQPPSDEAKRKNNMLLIGGILLIVVLVAVLVSQRKK